MGLGYDHVPFIWTASASMAGDMAWHGLEVGDLATWASAVATFLATALALWLAIRDSLKARAEQKRRARLVAAYLHVPLVAIRLAAERIARHCPRYAAVMQGARSIDVLDDAVSLQAACNEISSKIGIVRLDAVAALPKDAGEALASGLGELTLAIESIQSSLNQYFAASCQPNPDEERFDAAHGQHESHRIAVQAISKIDLFLAFCKKEFKST